VPLSSCARVDEMAVGVYFGFAQVASGRIYKMVMSVGWNPHFNDLKTKTLEVHLLHTFRVDFYGHQVRAIAVGFIRAMTAFDSLDGLIAAIRSDIAFARRSLSCDAELRAYRFDPWFAPVDVISSSATASSSSSTGNLSTSINVHPSLLWVASLPLDALRDSTHVLLKLLFFAAAGGRFFAMTRTDDELSFVLQADDLSTLRAHFGRNGALRVAPFRWRALELFEGSFGFTDASAVSLVAPALTAANVTIFYHSTCDADFVLVPEHRLPRALRVLRSVIARADASSSTTYLGDGGGGGDDDEHGDTGSDSDCECEAPKSKSEPVRRRLLVPANVELLMSSSFDAELLELAALRLINIVFYGKAATMLSITFIDHKCSLIVDRADAQQLPADLFGDDEHWSPLKIQGPLDFESVGIVSSLAEPITQHRIPIVYLSTFFTDYALAQSSDLLSFAKEHLSSLFSIEQ
jgi:hypothetical protein